MKKPFFLIALLIAGIANAQNYQWAFETGGPNIDQGYDITTDTFGNVYVTGIFRDTADFDPSGNTANLAANGDYDIFIAKYTADSNYVWAFNVGGTSADEGYGISTDPAGNGAVYVTGYFSDTADFDPSGNTANLIPNGSKDIFIAKYDLNGNYLWAFNVGGAAVSYGYGITIDTTGSGDVYVTGSFSDTADFDPSGNIANLISNGGSADIFIAKYNANGNYLWAISVGGASLDESMDIITDPLGTGNVYITGLFWNTADFDPSGNTAFLTAVAGDGFVAKYDNNGNYLWAFKIGGSGNDKGWDITTDHTGSGDLYVTGSFMTTVDFDPSGNAILLNSNGSTDIFIAKYDANSNYIWAFNIGGTDGDQGYSIATNATGFGDLYVTGHFRDVVDFDPSGNTANLSYNGMYDMFIARYDANGNYIWALSAGSTGDDRGYGIATDPVGSGDVFVTGFFSGTVDFEPSGDTANLTTNGVFDIFIAQYCDPYIINDSAITICTGDSVIIYGNYETTAGIYYDSLTMVSGCDSIHITNVVLDSAFNINDSPISICDGDSVIIYGNYETATGIYYDSLTTICGADSVHYTALTVNPTYNIIDNPITICDGDSALIYGNYETVAGNYYDTLTAINGCDSIHLVVVNVNTVDTSVTVVGNTFTSNATPATYQWYDCLADTLFAGETGQSYIGGPSGSIAVIVTQNGCTDTSQCFIWLGIGESESGYYIIIHPNPTTGQFTIQGATTEIQIFDLFGRLLLRSNEPEIDMSSYPAGLYVWRVGEARGKLVIE